jgi:hypothetical protein
MVFEKGNKLASKNKEEDEATKEETHEAGQIQPLVDVVAYRVWKNDKEWVDFPSEQQGLSIIASELFKLMLKAEE